MKDRLKRVNRCIQEKGEVMLEELANAVPEVSAMTLRRDLEALEHSGEIVRIRGGARSVRSLSERLTKEERYSMRQLENTEGKRILAEKAVKYIERGHSVFIDAGTTAMCLAGAMPDLELSVLTTAPNVALELLRRNKLRVTMAGGQLSGDNISVAGSSSLEFIKNINIDTAFMATSGFSLETGFTTGDSNESELKRMMVRRARQVVMLMDSTKVGKNLMFTFASLKDINLLVTDCRLPDCVRRAAEKEKVKII